VKEGAFFPYQASFWKFAHLKGPVAFDSVFLVSLKETFLSLPESKSYLFRYAISLTL